MRTHGYLLSVATGVNRQDVVSTAVGASACGAERQSQRGGRSRPGRRAGQRQEDRRPTSPSRSSPMEGWLSLSAAKSSPGQATRSARLAMISTAGQVEIGSAPATADIKLTRPGTSPAADERRMDHEHARHAAAK